MKNRFENNEACDVCADSGVILQAWFTAPAVDEDGVYEAYHWVMFTQTALGVINRSQPGAWQWNKSKCHIVLDDCTCTEGC